MKQTRIIMGMPIAVEIAEHDFPKRMFETVFDYFTYIDETFSTYKATSEVSRINSGTLTWDAASSDMHTILRLSEQTKQETNGYFDVRTPHGLYDPSGLVKGWAIYQAAQLLDAAGCLDYFIDAGGDIQMRRPDSAPEPWRVGIRNPKNRDEIIKVVGLRNQGMATSGTYIRGQHIYNPHLPQKTLTEVVSITVIGPNVYEADRFATAAFAMGPEGIYFIEHREGLEGYQVTNDGRATPTSGFARYVLS